MSLLERAVQTNQLRLIGRVLRNNLPFRTSISPATLTEAIQQFVAENPLRESAIQSLAEVCCS